MVNLAFSPREMTAPVGTKVTWTNRDPEPHTVTHDAPVSQKAFDQTLNPGQSFSFTFTTPGVFRYICMFHLGMEGTITVGDGGRAEAPKQPEPVRAADPYYRPGY